MSQMAGQCVLVFIRAPERGAVKTRLAASIGQEHAVGLYSCFVEDILAMLDTLEVDVVCCYLPADAETDLLDWLGPHRAYAPQRGNDLGQRMAGAFRGVFRNGVSKAVLIGSDSPDLGPDLIEQALGELTRHDVVIGPSCDGGYYLLGFTADGFLPEVFENVDWGTDRVFSQTLGVLNQRQRDVFVLPQWHDIDTRSDLDNLIDRNEHTLFRNSRTSQFIRGCAWNGPGKESKK